MWHLDFSAYQDFFFLDVLQKLVCVSIVVLRHEFKAIQKGRRLVDLHQQVTTTAARNFSKVAIRFHSDRRFSIAGIYDRR